MKLLLLTLAVLLLLSQLTPGNLYTSSGEEQGVGTEAWAQNPKGREDRLPGLSGHLWEPCGGGALTGSR